jgi:diacylglycerol O-acyltransferase / wax synthase
MSQEHLDRLSAIDASFLLQEGASTHMHIGGVATFEGPAPTYDEFLAHIRSRLALVPRYRQKLAEPPLRTGRPLWVDDPSFNLGYHVRHTALPEPGSEEQLLNLTSRIFSQRLDRTKPLWEMWLVEGLEGKRFALVTKTHHCLVDGVAGIDLMSTLFDLDPVPRRVDEEDWLPAPEPSSAQLLAGSLRAWVDTGREIAGGLLAAVTHPERTLERVREAAIGVGEVAWAGINPPPPTPLTGDIGPHRRFFVVRERLDDLKEIKNAFGGTVNDVVLAVMAGALATFMRSRGIRTEGLELRACVPVSVRTGDQEGTMGNRITQILCPLPVYIEDPVARLHFVREAMGGLKESKQALGAATIAGMEDFAPPTILAQASRLHFSTRMYTTLVTNIPGPQFPLYVLGRELQDVVPVAFLGGKRSLATAIMSYNGGISFGLIGDYDTLPDLEVIGEALSESIAELVALARRERELATMADPDVAGRAAARVETNGATE